MTMCRLARTRHYYQRVIVPLAVVRNEVISQRLRGHRSCEAIGKMPADPIGGEYQHVPGPQRNNRSVQCWQLAVAHHPGARQQLVARGQHARSSTADDAAHVADAQPAQGSLPQIDAGDAQDHATRSAQNRVTAHQQGCGLLLGMTQDDVRGQARGRRGLLAVTDAVDGRYERATTAVIVVQHLEVAGDPLTRCNTAGHSELQGQGSHFVIVTVVPLPALEAMSNSSMRRLTPGNPKARPTALEEPSRSARVRSAIPGPESLATIVRPVAPLVPWTGFSVTLPWFA